MGAHVPLYPNAVIAPDRSLLDLQASAFKVIVGLPSPRHQPLDPMHMHAWNNSTCAAGISVANRAIATGYLLTATGISACRTVLELTDDDQCRRGSK